MQLRFVFSLISVFLFENNAVFAEASSVFVSLKSSEINMRVGPGKEYPIAWIFMRSGLPMMLLAEFTDWRKVKFLDGTEGWIHKNMVSKASTVIVIHDNVLMYKSSSTSGPIARLEKGVIMKVLKRESDCVKVNANGMSGWVEKKHLWGLNDE